MYPQTDPDDFRLHEFQSVNYAPSRYFNPLPTFSSHIESVPGASDFGHESSFMPTNVDYGNNEMQHVEYLPGGALVRLPASTCPPCTNVVQSMIQPIFEDSPPTFSGVSLPGEFVDDSNISADVARSSSAAPAHIEPLSGNMHIITPEASSNRNAEPEKISKASKRQRRNEKATSLGLTAGKSTASMQKLDCPFLECSVTFASKDGWKRHQDNHFKRWTCMLLATHVINGHCGICGEADATQAHRALHVGLEKCLANHPVFRRCDKLCDHLRKHFGGHAPSDQQIAVRNGLLKTWVKVFVPGDAALWCGFCSMYCPTWESRQEHILKHISSGKVKLDWHPWQGML